MKTVQKVWRENRFRSRTNMAKAHGGRPMLNFRILPVKNQPIALGTQNLDEWFASFAVLLDGTSPDVPTLASAKQNQQYAS